MIYRALILILTFFVLFAAAQSPDKILKRAETALGGSRALQTQQSVVILGHITRVGDGATGAFRSEAGKPNLIHVEYDVAGDEVEVGFNGRSAWRRDSRNGLQTLTGTESLAMQTLAVLRNSLWLNRKAEKTKPVFGGTGTVVGRPANIVNLITQKGVTTKLFFDAVTSLPVRAEVGDLNWEFDDYQPAGAGKMPHRIRFTAGGQSYVVVLDEISINPTVAKSIFDFPTESGQPLPDLRKLFEELKANQERIEALLESYAYRERSLHASSERTAYLRKPDRKLSRSHFTKAILSTGRSSVTVSR